MLDAKRKAIIFFSFAFLLAIFAIGVVVNEWNKMKASWGDTVNVAVAKQNILPYSVITKDNIEWMELPKQFVTDSFISRMEQLENSITIVDIKKGDFFTPNVIRSKTDLAPGDRVVWLNISENVFLDQVVAPGDRIDIIVTYKDDKNLKTERLFQSVPVIQREDLDKGKTVVKVSLPLKDAERLIYYQNTAQQIRVLLANQIETTKDQEESNLSNLKTAPVNTDTNTPTPVQQSGNQNGNVGKPPQTPNIPGNQQNIGGVKP